MVLLLRASAVGSPGYSGVFPGGRIVAKELPDRLASLYRVGQVINSSLVLDEVLGLVIDNLIEVTGAERGAILLLDERGDLVVRAASSLDHRTLPGASFQTSRSLL